MHTCSLFVNFCYIIGPTGSIMNKLTYLLTYLLTYSVLSHDYILCWNGAYVAATLVVGNQCMNIWLLLVGICIVYIGHFVDCDINILMRNPPRI